MDEEPNDYDPDEYPNDYSNPNAVASAFAGIEGRFRELKQEIKKINDDGGGNGGVYLWGFRNNAVDDLVVVTQRQHSVLHRSRDRKLDVRDLFRFYALGFRRLLFFPLNASRRRRVARPMPPLEGCPAEAPLGQKFIYLRDVTSNLVIHSPDRRSLLQAQCGQ